MLEPSNPVPLANRLSLTSLGGTPTCCKVPGRSVNFRSMICTPSSATSFTTSSGVILPLLVFVLASRRTAVGCWGLSGRAPKPFYTLFSYIRMRLVESVGPGAFSFGFDSSVGAGWMASPTETCKLDYFSSLLLRTLLGRITHSPNSPANATPPRIASIPIFPDSCLSDRMPGAAVSGRHRVCSMFHIIQDHCFEGVTQMLNLCNIC